MNKPFPRRVCCQCTARLARDNRDQLCAACRRAHGDDRRAAVPDVPPHFWDHPKLQAALRARHMGRVIKAFREHPHHERVIAQTIVASWFYLTQSQLSRIESGPPIQDLDRLIQWATTLGMPPASLWFQMPPPDHRAEPISAPAPNPDARGRTAGIAVEVEALPPVAAALADLHRYGDGAIVGILREHLEQSKADDGNLGPATALPRVLGILSAVQHTVAKVKPAVRQALLAVGADGAEFTGWLYRDLRDLRAATYWYDRAIEWAHEADDTAMQGYVLLRKSQLAYDRRDALRVLTLARAAQRSSRRLPRKVRAEVTQQEALGLAMLGEPLRLVEQKLDRARHLLDRASAEEPGMLGSSFSASTLLLRSTACYTEAGKPAQAADILGEVISGGGLSSRDAGYFQARRSAALALIGEPDEAAIVGLQAAHIANATRSQRTSTVLLDTMHTLARWSARPHVRELREALTQGGVP
jgi:tetratricopeptide (TPR) repeat protein